MIETFQLAVKHLRHIAPHPIIRLLFVQLPKLSTGERGIVFEMFENAFANFAVDIIHYLFTRPRKGGRLIVPHSTWENICHGRGFAPRMFPFYEDLMVFEHSPALHGSA